MTFAGRLELHSQGWQRGLNCFFGTPFQTFHWVVSYKNTYHVDLVWSSGKWQKNVQCRVFTGPGSWTFLNAKCTCPCFASDDNEMSLRGSVSLILIGCEGRSLKPRWNTVWLMWLRTGGRWKGLGFSAHKHTMPWTEYNNIREEVTDLR